MSPLELAWAEASRRWPAIKLERETFEQFVSARAADADTSAHGVDLFLACAASHGDQAAIGVIDALLATEATRAMGKLGLDEAARDDVRQAVREKLFVRKSSDSEPTITRYSGRGPLGAWLRASLVHMAVSTLRSAAREPENVSLSRLPDNPTSDVDLVALRARYGQAFKAAFHTAFLALTPRERNVLRLTYIDGLSAEQVGSVYGVHRVSVARWLGETKKALLERTRAALKQELDLASDELSSVTRLCLSQIDVSLERLLQDTI